MNILNKINISQIIKDHFKTLVNDNSQKPGLDDYFTFLILPIVIASALVCFCITLSDSSINIIITTLSILVGLLFNVIVLIFDIIRRDSAKKIKNRLLEQLVANISFSILVCIIAILITLVTFIDNSIAIIISSWLVYFLLTIFMFTVLMILKRIHKIFTNEFSELIEQ